MSIGERIPAETKRKLKETKRKETKLSERDLKELMDVHKDTYKRVNGRIRRK